MRFNMNMVHWPRRTKYFRFLVGSYYLQGNLRESIVIEHIRGALQYPERAIHHGRHYNPYINLGVNPRHPTNEIDLTPVVSNCDLYRSQTLSGNVFISCLQYIISILDLAQEQGGSARGKILAGLQTLWNKYPYEWGRILKLYACYSYLLNSSVLHGSENLKCDLGDFVTLNLPRFTRELPLKYCLQFIQLCPESHFHAAMEILLETMDGRGRYELLLRGGRVTLPLIGRPSRRIEGYLHRFLPRRPPPYW